MNGSCSTHRVDRKCMHNYVWKPEVNEPFVRPRHIWDGSIRMYQKKTGYGLD